MGTPSVTVPTVSSITRTQLSAPSTTTVSMATPMPMTAPPPSSSTKLRAPVSGRSSPLHLQGSARSLRRSQMLRALSALTVRLLDPMASLLPTPPSPTPLPAGNTSTVSLGRTLSSLAALTASFSITLSTSVSTQRRDLLIANAGTAVMTPPAPIPATLTAPVPSQVLGMGFNVVSLQCAVTLVIHLINGL